MPDELRYMQESYMSMYDEGYVPLDRTTREKMNTKAFPTPQTDDKEKNKQEKLSRGDKGAPPPARRPKRRKLHSEYIPNIINYLVTEGYCPDIDSAENIIDSMSDAWIDTILKNI